MYRRFGAEVTVVERGPRLTAREDEDVSAAIKDILETEGIDRRSRRRRRCSSAKQDSDSGDSPSDAARRRRTDRRHPLLVATGRQPNTDDLGLEAAGVETDGRGYVVVDDQLRTNVGHIWAMGDCNGKGAFTHTSYNDFEIVAANLLDDDPRRVSDRITDLRALHRPAAGPGRDDEPTRSAGRAGRRWWASGR